MSARPEAQRAPEFDTPRRDKRAARWIQAGLFAATGAAGSLWLCQFEPLEVTHSLSWLFLAVVLASWPAYLAWRHSTAAGRQQQTLAAFHEGYATGYLRGVTDRLTGASVGDDEGSADQR
ncbi:hypothetical protein Ait01nite_029860 [Actinoplanes italicus]|uniref:Uncharacterized protein n=1 Tax=Actinoplanes italicus TaxID=113567 RepID=A0A2T0KIT2_9ACTN|nr:hypothetical protein [Actinoplanes italicus]PRX23442.1 hypothetical protein CLV67_103190 [Actinoplanes italicus]GIE29941.1 hypothetical protein Ait01nite_029860 [Actinoplanes italicus]